MYRQLNGQAESAKILEGKFIQEVFMNLLSDANFPGGVASEYSGLIQNQTPISESQKHSKAAEINLLQAEPLTNPFESPNPEENQGYPNDLLDLTDFEAISPGKSDNLVSVGNPEVNLLDENVNNFIAPQAQQKQQKDSQKVKQNADSDEEDL